MYVNILYFYFPRYTFIRLNQNKIIKSLLQTKIFCLLFIDCNHICMTRFMTHKANKWRLLLFCYTDAYKSSSLYQLTRAYRGGVCACSGPIRARKTGMKLWPRHFFENTQDFRFINERTAALVFSFRKMTKTGPFHWDNP